jgi:2-oxo-4-hydroxy-4-carboxy-5-ureidoimidazoline decarboxylase
MDPRLVEALRVAARALGVGTGGGGGDVPTAVSGALHDSAVLAPHLPTVMLFVPSQDGISHNPAEFSRVVDVAAGARVIEQLVRRPAVAALNTMDRGAFVRVLGSIYEHSPWVADRAWGAAPFASMQALASVMRSVVANAARAEQLALIRAHPDLVGRLAREGRLTRESTTEQSAAGLTALTSPETEAFERHNAAYRERFGFPFVICARENKKEAILAAFPARMANSLEQEVATALAEIDKIAALRLADLLWESPER